MLTKRSPLKAKVEVKDPAGFVRAGEQPRFSGRQPGEKLPALTVVAISGNRKCKEYDPVAEAIGKPQVIILIDQSEVTMEGLFFQAMMFDQIVKKLNARLDVVVVVLGDDLAKIDASKFS